MIGVARDREAMSMSELATVGLDLAKNVFRVHGVDQLGAVRIRRRLRRSEVLRFVQSFPP